MVNMYFILYGTFRQYLCRRSRYVFTYSVTQVRSAYAIIVRVTPVMDRANPT